MLYVYMYIYNYIYIYSSDVRWCDVARCTWHLSEPDTRLWEAGADSWVAMGRQEAEALQQPNMLARRSANFCW